MIMSFLNLRMLKLIWSKILALSILLLLGVIIYSNTFLGPFHFDDIYNIVDNPAIKHLFNLGNIWNSFPARFVTFFSFALNYQIHQLNVVGYHIVNLIVHLGSALLLWWLASLTLLTPVMKEQKIAQQAKLVSFFIALVFLTHPIQTQGVTYITQRATSLATLFYLASLSCYAKFRLLQSEESAQGSRKAYYFGALITAVIAMFTKEMVITLPLAICLYEFSFFKTPRRLNYKQLIPFLSTLLVIPLTMLATKSGTLREMWRVNEGSIAISFWHYLLTKLMVMATYVRLAFLPLNQNLDYDFPIVMNILRVPILVSLFFLVGFIIAAFRLFRNYRLVSFGILFFFLTMLFEWSIIPIPEAIYEHRLYLPMVGFSIFLVSSLYYLVGSKNLKAMLTLLIILVISYSILTYSRNNVWKDDLTLWNDTVHKSPHKARPYNNRGLAYQNKGDFNLAFSDYSKTIEIDPKDAEAYKNRAEVYFLNKKYDQAWEDVRKAQALGYKVKSDFIEQLQKSIQNEKSPY